jgi:chemotaxis response regulator CheB
MTDQTPIRVVLVDDHTQMHRIVQQTLDAALDVDLVGQGVNGKEAIALCVELSLTSC